MVVGVREAAEGRDKGDKCEAREDWEAEVMRLGMRKANGNRKMVGRCETCEKWKVLNTIFLKHWIKYT